MQKAAKNAAAIGIGAGSAKLACKIFQIWQQSRSGEPAPALSLGSAQGYQSIQGAIPGWGGAGAPALEQSQDAQAEILLEAMVFAARADGHIDAEEEKLILQSAGQLAPGGSLQSKVSKVLKPNDLAAKVSDPEQKRDLYLLSALIVKPDTFVEQNYLVALEHAQGLSSELKAELDDTAAMQRQALLSAS